LLQIRREILTNISFSQTPSSSQVLNSGAKPPSLSKSDGRRSTPSRGRCWARRMESSSLRIRPRQF